MEKEARLSFLSGHASVTFATMTLISLYLSGKFGLFRKGPSRGHIWKLYVCILIPQAAAMFVALSRIRDYWHHCDDVLAGAVLGVACGFIGYFMHFPALSNETSHQPLNRKIQPTTNPNLFHPLIHD